MRNYILQGQLLQTGQLLFLAAQLSLGLKVVVLDCNGRTRQQQKGWYLPSLWAAVKGQCQGDLKGLAAWLRVDQVATEISSLFSISNLWFRILCIIMTLHIESLIRVCGCYSANIHHESNLMTAFSAGSAWCEHIVTVQSFLILNVLQLIKLPTSEHSGKCLFQICSTHSNIFWM